MVVVGAKVVVGGAAGGVLGAVVEVVASLGFRESDGCRWPSLGLSLGGGASALPADSGSDARPIRWLTRWLAATEIAAATASPRSASRVQRNQPGTITNHPVFRDRQPTTWSATATTRSPLGLRARPCS